jgi:hypothetical protein
MEDRAAAKLIEALFETLSPLLKAGFFFAPSIRGPWQFHLSLRTFCVPVTRIRTRIHERGNDDLWRLGQSEIDGGHLR